MLFQLPVHYAALNGKMKGFCLIYPYVTEGQMLNTYRDMNFENKLQRKEEQKLI
jgi:hypothetical protein